MSQTIVSVERSLSRVDADSVRSTADVRHFDQLSEAAQNYIAMWARNGTVATPIPDDLEAGDAIVFTDYVVVQ